MYQRRTGGNSATSSIKKYSLHDRAVLEKRVHSNPRYEKVKSRTDTGFNTRRRQELQNEIHRYYKVRNDEVFRRISLSDMMELMIAFGDDQEATGGFANCQENGSQHKDCTLPLKMRDGIDEVVHQMDKIKLEQEELARRQRAVCPYLIVDVRTEPQYQAQHITTAVSYPHTRLSRAIGYESSHLLTYKNDPNRIIIFYDEEEDLAPMVASTLLQRGYENVFVLSGGLKLAREKIGTPLVTSNPSPALTSQLVQELVQALAAAVLPPLNIDGASDWWAQASGRDSTVAGSSRSRSRGPSPQKNKEAKEVKKPWR